MSRRVLVTGINGFVGPYLVRALEDAGHEVVGTRFGPFPPHPLALRKGLEVVELDIRRSGDVVSCLDRLRPEGILHLAAFSEPHKSVQLPLMTAEINLIGTLNLFEAMKRVAASARCVVVSSGDVYGSQRPGAEPFTEASAFAPRNPYSLTKAAADWMAETYARPPHGLDLVRVRPFNHSGPGQQRGLVCPDLAHGVAEIASRGERRGQVPVGNLESAKDFSDVRDVVRAYVLVLEHGERGAAYNVCSGRTLRIRDILSELGSIAEIDVEPVPNPSLAGSPITQVRASAARLAEQCGWRPEIPFEQTLRELYEYCRGTSARGGVGRT